MNNAKMWLVVHPTVGVPLFLGAVAVGSFCVHVAVVTNTTWVSDFLSGNEMGSTETASIEPSVKAAKFVTADAKVYQAGDASDEMMVVLGDGRIAKAKFEQPLASNALPAQ